MIDMMVHKDLSKFAPLKKEVLRRLNKNALKIKGITRVAFLFWVMALKMLFNGLKARTIFEIAVRFSDMQMGA